MSSWSKFHEKHGNVTSKRPQQVYGSYMTDPRQYERSTNRQKSMMTKVVSCLGCLVGKPGLYQNHHQHHRSRNIQENIDTRYMYNTTNSFEYRERSAGHNYLDKRSIMKSRGRFQIRRNRSQGNINYLQ